MDDWGTPVEIERRNRIRLTAAAYAYEFLNDPIMSDAEFDDLCKQIDLSVDTGNPVLDNYFREHFIPDTGQWIHDHPELDKVLIMCRRILKRLQTANETTSNK